MKPLYSVAAIRAIEQAAAASLPPGTLMQRAGQAGAAAAMRLLPVAPARARVLVLAGPGNNGGDALETAARMAHAGAQVTVWHLAPAGATSAERDQAMQRVRASAARFTDLSPATLQPGQWDLIIDGLFGIGLQRPLAGAVAALVEAVNGLDCQVLALDLPSGLDGDSGAVVGPDGVAVRASHTLTFIGDKPGLHTCDGRDYSGAVEVAGLEIDAALYPATPLHLNAIAFFARQLRLRRHNSHKGSFGNVAVLGGARGMGGATILAARSALCSGAGRVYAVFLDEAPAYDSGQPELMCRPADAYAFDGAALVAGPGMGMAPAARALLLRAIASPGPLLADADALNLLAADGALQQALAARKGAASATIVTPHPLEAARLLDITVAQVQADRIGAARRLAARLQATVVLKGSGSVIARADGVVAINPTGNPALASAGSGDVLSGLAGSLLAQGWPAWEAALAAVWLHGAAADQLVADGQGPIGIAAGELVPAIRAAFNQMVRLHGR